MSDDGFVKVARLDDIRPGRMIAVRAGEVEIALYNVDGRIHATRESCTHQAYPLSKGELRGKYVKCELHGWEFDVTNGEYQGNPEVHVGCFPVKVEGDEVWVGTTRVPPPPRPFVSRDDA